MARKSARPEAKSVERLETLGTDCPRCSRNVWADFNRRSVAALDGLIRLEKNIRRCRNACCRWARPLHELVSIR